MLSVLRQRSSVPLRIIKNIHKNEQTRIADNIRSISMLRNSSGQSDITLRGEYIRVSEEVKKAIVDNKPIVALESTIITHGMPYPHNFDTTKKVQQIIRDQGAVPATIAVIGGRISIGLDDSNLETLAKGLPGIVKVSRRDLPRVLAMHMNGGTTVSGTMAIAHKMGIHVFVTGGIGGVHRCGESTMDISADLVEMGRTPICVVSSGVKSILDIQRTLEYLETHGVCVVTYGQNKDFPAFFTSRSGYQSPGCINDPADAAHMIKASMDLKLNSGLLLAVPVPEQFSLDEVLIEDAIQEALRRAETAGIRGRDVTPFLLAATASLTEGKSLNTNIALIKNNAEIGAKIAVELSKIVDKPKREFVYDAHVSDIFVAEYRNIGNEKQGTYPVKCIKPVVLGGKNADYTIKIEEDDVRLDGSTHKASIAVSTGGVGYNMAKCLQKLGASPVFITNAGPGDSANLDVRCPHSSRNAATYMAVFDQSGECKIGLGDMKAHDTITPELVANNISALEDAPLIVMDGNIPLNTMAYVLKKAEEMGKPVFFEPTDIRKATKPFQTNLRNPIKFISPNLNELKAIGQFFGYNKNFVPDNINSVLDVGKYISKFVDNSIITMGKNGVLLVRKCSNSTTYARHYEYQSVSKIVNVSGAGDCLASGFILALLTGAPEEVCISVAFEAATMSVMDEQSVPENMFNQNHPCWTTKSSFKTLM